MTQPDVPKPTPLTDRATREMLTEDERNLIVLLGQAADAFAKVCGNGRSRTGDIAEMVDKVHQLQASVMAQAAARAYPDLFRLLGEGVSADVVEVHVDPDAFTRYGETR